jgi:hypothetical protein
MDLRRLRAGEWIVAVSGAALLASLFLPWYGRDAGSATGELASSAVYAPVTIAAATREGPFQMPRFGEELVSDEEIAHIVAFLDEGVHEPTSPLGLSEVSKFEAVGFAALLTVAVALVCAWAGGARRKQAGRQAGDAEPADEG